MPALITDPMYDYGASLTPVRKIREIKFGNNYSQRAREGINGTRQKWKLSWKRITEAQSEAIREFFEDLGGVSSFTWTPDGQSTELKWVERDISITHNDFDQYAVSVEIEQVFDNA